MISSIDDQVGAVTDALKAKCMWDNTVVVFVSDVSRQYVDICQASMDKIRTATLQNKHANVHYV